MRARLRTQAGDTASRQAKGLVGDQALVVEVGRLELPCLVIRVYRHHAALMAESGR
jgi:hypothetical protein